MEKLPVPFKSESFDPNTLYELSVLSCLAYLPKEQVFLSLENRGYTYQKFVENPSSKTQAYIASSETDIVVFFSGTKESEDIITDISFNFEKYSFGEEVHSGFYFAWRSLAYAIRREVRTLQITKKRRVWFAGHSLGAAIAVIGALDMCDKNFSSIDGVYTYGMPRVFNKKLSVRYDKLLGDKTFRTVNTNDLVTSIPLKSMGYAHVGKLVYIDRQEKVRVKSSRIVRSLDKVLGWFTDLFDGKVNRLADHNRHLYARACLKNVMK